MAPLCVKWVSSPCERASPKSSSFTTNTALRRAALRPGLQPDVAGLDVAVDEPPGVGGGQPLGHLVGDADRLGDGEFPGAAEPVFQRLALEEGHRQEGHAVVLADLEDGDDVRVLDGRGGAGLAEESLLVLRVLGDGRQHGLERDLAAELRVLGEEDHAHAAGPELLQDAVRPEPADLVGLLGGAEEGDGASAGRPGRDAQVADGSAPRPTVCIAPVRQPGDGHEPGQPRCNARRASPLASLTTVPSRRATTVSLFWSSESSTAPQAAHPSRWAAIRSTSSRRARRRRASAGSCA